METEVQLKRLLVAVDASRDSSKAFSTAAFMAKNLGAELILVHVIHAPQTAGTQVGTMDSTQVPHLASYYSLVRQEAERILQGYEKLANGMDVKTSPHIIEYASSVVQAIVEYAASQQADLIVMGSRGLGRFKQLLLGSVSVGVVNHAHCSVLIVR